MVETFRRENPRFLVGGLSILAHPIFRSLGRKCENTLPFCFPPLPLFRPRYDLPAQNGARTTSNLIQNTINLSEKTRRLEVHTKMCRILRNVPLPLPSFSSYLHSLENVNICRHFSSGDDSISILSRAKYPALPVRPFRRLSYQN